MTNQPNYDAAMRLSSTVGTNIRTLRDNKRKLAHNLVLAIAVEDHKRRDVYDAARKAAKFAAMEKPEQNSFSVMLASCTVIVDAWHVLTDDVRDAFKRGEIVFSTLATSIRDADKAKKKAEDEAEETAKAGGEASKEADADCERKPEAPASVPVSPICNAVNVLVAALNAPLTTKHSDGDMAALRMMLDEVDAFRARLVEAASKAA